MMKFKKLRFIKRLLPLKVSDDYMEIKRELEDRYSNIPDSVYNLMDIAYIKSIAKCLYIEEIKETAKEIKI